MSRTPSASGLMSGRGEPPARATYAPAGARPHLGSGRSQSALSRRSGASSVMHDASRILGKATGVLGARPQTAKTTKTVLSHRLRNGFTSTLRDGDIVKHAGARLPRPKQYDMEVDHSTGDVRRRPVKARPATALGTRAPSCRRMPGYKAPVEDYGPEPPGEASETEYHRPEDLPTRNPGYQ